MQGKAQAWLQTVSTGKYNDLLVIFLAMAYVTIKLTCNLMSLRPVGVTLIGFPDFGNIPAATFLYPVIYVLNVNILMLSNKKIAITVALVGIVCDGIFSFGSNYSTHFPIPHNMSISELKNTLAINTIAGYMWNFYDRAIIISIIASFLSINLFLLCRKVNLPLFLTMLISTYVPLIIHHMVKIDTKINIETIFNNFVEYSIIYIAILIICIMATFSVKLITE